MNLCDAVAAVVGPVLAEKKANDRLLVMKAAESLSTQLKRLLGPHYFGRKLAIAATIVAGRLLQLRHRGLRGHVSGRR